LPHLEDSIVIDRPIDEVWAWITDLFNLPRLSGAGTIAWRQTSPGHLGVGSTLQGRRVILGFETRNNYRVTEWDPPHALALTGEGRPIRSLGARVTLESRADGTQLVVSGEIELHPVMKLLWPFMGPFVRRRFHASLAHVKMLIVAEPR
jgi:hypothetical protein